MASVITDKAGNVRIEFFVESAGKRQKLRLGKADTRTVQDVKAHLERLIEHHRFGTAIDARLSAWVDALPDPLHERIARIGLVVSREQTAATLGVLIDRFEESLEVKPGTAVTYKQATESLRAHFGADRLLRSIKPSEAADWRRALSDSGLAKATIAKRVRVAKMVFGKAVRWKMIPSDPFAELKSGSQANPDREHYVEVAVLPRLFEYCPDVQWRGIVALARLAGLRCPSEIMPLTWADVNWERGRLTVRSRKTEGYEGGAIRLVPIVPELRAVLLELFESAPEGATHIIPRLREPGANLRTTFQKIIIRAGLEPWPRLFQNLRASCATDWVERFPAHTVAAWMGHSPQIAAKHYLQVRDSHFDDAAGLSGVHGGAEAAHFAAQSCTVIRGQFSSPKTQTPASARDRRTVTKHDDRCKTRKVTPGGFEPPLPG
jgi:integrase